MHLSVLLASFSQPLPQAISLVAAGLFWLCMRRYRTGLVLCVLGVGWLGLCATPAFAHWLLDGLEAGYPPRAASAYPTADAIVVLGGGGLPHFDSASPNEAVEALGTPTGFSLALFRAARAPLIILSGGDREAANMARLLRQQGVPAASLRLENASANTYQNALYSAVLLHREKLQRILLVTSPSHMRRAAASFEHQGFTVISAPAPKRRLSFARRWLPQRAALTQSGHYLREYIGLWVYTLRGWA